MSPSNITIGIVVVLALSTGQEVIGKVLNANAREITLEKALGLGYDFQNGQMGFGFIPHGPLVEENKTYQVAHVVYAAVPKDRLMQEYANATGGIVTPPKGLILG